MQETTFCPGCGKNELKFEPRTEAYEHPCTFYDGKSREYIIRILKDKLTTAQLNAVLKYYDYKPIDEQ